MSLEGNFEIKNLHRPNIIGRMQVFIIGILATVIAAIAPETIGATAWLIAANIVIAVSIGLAGYSIFNIVSALTASGARRTLGPSQTQNGQLVNGKNSNAPLRVIYGILKVGGNWVFSRSSPANINILNFIVTWGEGELTGLAPAIDYTPLFSGSGLNDLHTGGNFVYVGCTCDTMCYGYSACSCDFTTY